MGFKGFKGLVSEGFRHLGFRISRFKGFQEFSFYNSRIESVEFQGLGSRSSKSLGTFHDPMKPGRDNTQWIHVPQSSNSLVYTGVI